MKAFLSVYLEEYFWSKTQMEDDQSGFSGQNLGG